jgi:hypothetical protein
MATEFIHSAQTITKMAAVDLTLNQHKFVKLDANGNVIAIAAATDVPYGLLLNAPKIGEEAHIGLTGFLKVIVSAAVAIGDYLGVSADGRVVKVTLGTDTTKYVVGRAHKEAAAAANVLIQIEVNTLIPRTA